MCMPSRHRLRGAPTLLAAYRRCHGFHCSNEILHRPSSVACSFLAMAIFCFQKEDTQSSTPCLRASPRLVSVALWMNSTQLSSGRLPKPTIVRSMCLWAVRMRLSCATVKVQVPAAYNMLGATHIWSNFNRGFNGKRQPCIGF